MQNKDDISSLRQITIYWSCAPSCGVFSHRDYVDDSGSDGDDDDEDDDDDEEDENDDNADDEGCNY